MTQIFRGEPYAPDGNLYVATVSPRNGPESPEDEERRMLEWMERSMARRHRQKEAEANGDYPFLRLLLKE